MSNTRVRKIHVLRLTTAQVAATVEAVISMQILLEQKGNQEKQVKELQKLAHQILAQASKGAR